MIPNVDEDSVHTEFNLKQIDAPMPEAPWIKRCTHGITFTSQAHLEKLPEHGRQKYKWLLEQPKKGIKQIDKKFSLPGNDLVLSANAASARLLDQIQEDSTNDKLKVVSLDDSRIYDEECPHKECESNF